MFGTWAGSLAILGDEIGVHGSRNNHAWLVFIITTLLVGLGTYTFRRRADVFPLTLIAGSLIVFGTCAIAKKGDYEPDNMGLFFVLALWLIVSSTLAGRGLARLVRAWRNEQSST
jgi:uncharacterized membrane protein